MPALQHTFDGPDSKIRTRLEALSESQDDFWAFRGRAKRGHAHALFQYPAMMVPQMQGELIRAVTEAVPGLGSAFDPYVGSGTTLTEAMMHGLRFTGWDINPLAVLLCQVKSGPLYPAALEGKLGELMGRFAGDGSDVTETSLPNVCKWFRPEVAAELSRLRRAIRGERACWARKFFWVALADAVRLSSNSRTSTFKLHIRPSAELHSRPSPGRLFEEASRRNIEHLSTQRRLLVENGLVRKGRYLKPVEVALRDSSEPRLPGPPPAAHDLLISSPPYGDNKSTVPYGQYSYLPLSWIDGLDIDPSWDDSWLTTTHEIDTRSLGGRREGSRDAIAPLSSISPSFRDAIGRLKAEPPDRTTRVTAFCRDLSRALGGILAALRPGAYMIWTVGNRRVGGHLLPLDRILVELLAARGCPLVASVTRTILSKRMAVRNSVSNTMSQEAVLVIRK